MGTTVQPMPGGKALRDYPGLAARVGRPSNRVLTMIALFALGASRVLTASPIVWSDPRTLVMNGAFWQMLAYGSAGLVVLRSLIPGRQLTPIKALKRREQWGKGIGAVFTAVVVAQFLPGTPLGLDISVGRVDIRAINDEQLLAAVVVLSDLRILNTREENVDLTFSVDVVSRGEGGGEFSAVTDCSITNGTVLAERLEELGLGGYMRTPLNIAGGSPIDGRLCLWTTGDHPAPFAPDLTLHIRDGVSQDISSVEINQAGGSYEALMVRPAPTRVARAGR